MSEATVSIVLFLVGFFILVKGAQILVRGASSVAKLFGVSNWFIGIVLVGIGTSIPEFAINVAAALSGSSIGVSTIIGSNTFNILFILGLSSLLAPFAIRKSWMKDVWANLAVTVAAALVIIFPIAGPEGFAGITRLEGFLLLGIFLTWVVLVLGRDEKDSDGGADYEIFTLATSVFMVLAGLAGVFLGGQWVVDGARTIALAFAASDELVGLTIVAIGTSLPELTVSLVAAIRGQSGIAVGNIIGSNIFDFGGILGIAALFAPIAIGEGARFDIFATIGAALLFLAAVYVFGKRYHITRFDGLIKIGAYAAYVAAIFFRG